jgi:hypothetical protein
MLSRGFGDIGFPEVPNNLENPLPRRSVKVLRGNSSEVVSPKELCGPGPAANERAAAGRSPNEPDLDLRFSIYHFSICVKLCACHPIFSLVHCILFVLVLSLGICCSVRVFSLPVVLCVNPKVPSCLSTWIKASPRQNHGQQTQAQSVLNTRHGTAKWTVFFEESKGWPRTVQCSVASIASKQQTAGRLARSEATGT